MVMICSVYIVSCEVGGQSKVSRKQDSAGNYAFGYNILDPKGASNFRKEQGDASGNMAGSYGLKDVDGRERIVQYVADKGGFRAKILTNEPGTGNADTAGAIYNGPDPSGAADTVVQAGSDGASKGPSPHFQTSYEKPKGKQTYDGGLDVIIDDAIGAGIPQLR